MKDNGPVVAADRRARVGFVGLGGMGRNHASNVTDQGHDVVAGVDVAGEARREFASVFGAETYESHGAMFGHEDLDAVIVTTPNAFHADAVVAALAEDVPVLCEKPLAADLAGAERVAEAAADADAFCMVGFHNRFSLSAAAFTEFREAGRFGEIRHVDANYVRRRGVPGVGSWFTDAELAGGGALVDLGVHLVDLALYLAGYPEPREVTGVTRSDFVSDPGYVDPDGWSDDRGNAGETVDVDDSASAFVRCADGTTISLEVAWASNRPTDSTVVVSGTEAGAECAVGGETLTVYETGAAGGDHYSDTTIEGRYEPSGWAAEDAYFLRHALAGVDPELNTVQQGLTVQRVLDAIYRADASGSAVRLE
jgi:predicted dehydrogenase